MYCILYLVLYFVLSVLYSITRSFYSCCSFRICMCVWYMLLNIYLLTYLLKKCCTRSHCGKITAHGDKSLRYPVDLASKYRTESMSPDCRWLNFKQTRWRIFDDFFRQLWTPNTSGDSDVISSHPIYASCLPPWCGASSAKWLLLWHHFQFYSNNATNLPSLNFTQYAVLRHSMAITDCCDVISPHVT